MILKENSNPVFCLMGPTASGKTQASLALAGQFACDIINVDSAMVYRGMDIGSAKPDLATRTHIPHYLIDIRDPAETYSAGDFCRDALEAIQQSVKNQRIPLLTGGTMLYFKALQQGMAALPQADKKLREKITLEAHQEGWPALHEKLKNIDPETAARLHPNDAQRIQRALEVYELTGVALSDWHKNQPAQNNDYPVRFINIALMPENREDLKTRIALRFHEMLEEGFIQEVEKLYARADLRALGHENCPALRAVGYRQAWDYLSGKISKAQMTEQAVTATRQLAKRQLTWLRQWPGVQVFASESPSLLTHLGDFLRAQNTKSHR